MKLAAAGPIVFLALAAGCQTAVSNGTQPTPVPASAAPPSVASDARWADSVLRTLTLREKAGQMVWPTVLGDYVPSDSRQWRLVTSNILEDKVGGFTISVGSPLEIAAKLNAMQEMSSVPLIVGADLEQGAGYRARGGYFIPNAIDLGGAVLFPPQMALGATGDEALAYEEGKLTAIEGRALGIHVVYSPILDVNNNPANPVINTRSFSEDPALTARLGAAFIRGIQDNGMLATGKHFPGHGDTGTNSHLALPVVTVSRSRLDSVELVPFRAAVQAGVGAIMSFHGAMPALDPSGVPGTLSARVMTGVLRGELGFRGLIISDAMDMRGVLNQYGADEATKRSVAAGIDVLIQPLDVRKTIDAVVAGVAEGRYTEVRLDSSVRRILEAKRSLGLNRRKTVEINAIRGVVGDSTHIAVATRIAERSVTLVRDSLDQIPVRRSTASGRPLLISVARRAELSAASTFNSELAAGLGPVRAEVIGAEDPAVNFSRFEAAADSASVVIISSYVGHNWEAVTASAPEAFADFVKRLIAKGRRPILVSFGNPYLLQQIPGVPAYVVAWGGSSASQRAAARAILGAIPINGRLPVSIPLENGTIVKRGTGIVKAAIR